MLLRIEISMKIQTKIQNQPNISFNILIMFFNRKFWCQHLCKQLFRAFSLEKLFFVSSNSLGECTMISLTSIWLLSKFDWSLELLVGCFHYRFIVGFNEQFFRRMILEAASGNAVLQLFLLTVDAIFPLRYQLYLTCLV